MTRARNRKGIKSLCFQVNKSKICFWLNPLNRKNTTAPSNAYNWSHIGSISVNVSPITKPSDRIGLDPIRSDPIRSDKSDDPIRQSEITNDFYV